MTTVAIQTGNLPPFSDKVVLPPDVLSTVVDTYGDKLPHPLIFRVQSSTNTVFVGVSQFTAPDDSMIVPETIRQKLQVDQGDEVQLQVADDVVKGTTLKLQPMQFYPEIHNWKYYLESNLTKYYTVLNNHEKLILNGYELMVEDLNASVVSIIDTDLVLDVVPLNDIMAHQQLNFSFDTSEEIGLQDKTLTVEPFKNFKVQVFRLDLFSLKSDVLVKVVGNNLCNVDLVVGDDKLVSLDNFKFSTVDQDFDAEKVGSKSVRVPYEYIEERVGGCRYDLDQGFDLDDINHWLYVVPFSWEESESVRVSVREEKRSTTPSEETSQQIDASAVAENIESPVTESPVPESPVTDTVICSNCRKPISKSQFQLHEVFCLKNNIKCTCGAIFLKTIPSSHWHCPQCLQYSSTPLFRFKHERMNHQQFQCEKCPSTTNYSTFVDLILNHRSTKCPAKLHECKFCHLILEQGEADYIDNFENLTHHENDCGNKTDECSKCGKNIKRKDFRKHYKLHKLEKQSDFETFKLKFTKCSNQNCVNGSANTNMFQLCESCFGPLYNSVHDPTHIKLQSRIERRYMLQLNKGCEFADCHNIYCKKNSQPFGSIKEVLNLIQHQLIIHIPFIPMNTNGSSQPQPCFWFCVNDTSTRKMLLFQTYKDTYDQNLVLKGINELRELTSESLSSWLQQN